MQQDKRYSHKQRKIFGVVAAVFFALSAVPAKGSRLLPGKFFTGLPSHLAGSLTGLRSFAPTKRPENRVPGAAKDPCSC